MPSPFATNEDPTKLWFEQSNYISTHVSSVGYGIHVAVFAVATFYTIRERRNRSTWIGWLIFNSLLFVIGTINLACSINFNEDAWINERNYPGGPFAFIVEQQARPVLTLGNTASILASFMADGLLLYRVMILWDYTWYIIILPTIFYLVSIILSVMTVIQFALPSTISSINLSLPVWLVLMIINIVLTAMIATRILLSRQKLKALVGEEHANIYSGTAAIVIESALPFTILSIILLGLFGGNNIAQNLFVPLLVQVECIAPELIILRVMMGRAWSRDTLSPHETRHSIVFAAGNTTMSESNMDASERGENGFGTSSTLGANILTSLHSGKETKSSATVSA